MLGEEVGVLKDLEMGPLSMRPRWETWKGTHMLGAYVWKNVLGGLSLPVGEPIRNLGRWGRLPGTLRIGCMRAVAVDHLSQWEFC